MKRSSSRGDDDEERRAREGGGVKKGGLVRRNRGQGGCVKGKGGGGGGRGTGLLCEVLLCLPVRMRPLNWMIRTDKTICVWDTRQLNGFFLLCAWCDCVCVRLCVWGREDKEKKKSSCMALVGAWILVFKGCFHMQRVWCSSNECLCVFCFFLG